MGEVYKARDTRLDRAVAVKILSAEFAQNAAFKIRFEREAKTISHLSHPNICTLFDVGDDYIVMELLDGDSLADRLAKGPLPLPEVLKYGVQVAEALGKAHQQGVIHRDLKPGNVMITRSGAKLLDFGLAKTSVGASALAGSAAAGTAAATHQKPLTQEGVVLGTFQYMAPEQLAGEEPDARTDIFALGALLYEMATGKRAFEGKTKTSLIGAIVSGEPKPISELQPLTPPALEHVIKKCLAKDPEDRWQSATDIAEELRWISEAGSQAGVAGVIVSRRQTREQIWIAIAAAALITTAALSFALRRTQVLASRSISAAIILAPGISFDWDDIASLTLSPDGKFVTFAARPAEGKSSLWIRRLDSAEAKLLNGTERTTQAPLTPFWSPDSKSLAFFAGGKLKRIDIEGGPAATIADAGNGRGGSWNSDGVIIFSPNYRDAIYRVSANGGPVTAITKVDEAHGETTHRWATFLPDGKHFLYLAGSHRGSERKVSAIYVGSLDSGERRLLLRADMSFIVVPGYLLFGRENYLMAQRFNSRTQKLSGEPIRIAENVANDAGYFRAALAASNDGMMAYLTGQGAAERRLLWYDRNGKEIGSFGTSADYTAIRFSPDGKRLAVAMGTPYTDVWIYDIARGVRTRFTSDPLNDWAPLWSPDGKQILFGSNRVSVGDLYVKPVDGLTRERPLAKFNASLDPLDWSSDGRLVSVQVSDPKSERLEIWLVPTDGMQKPYAFISSEFNTQNGRFSPDMRWFTFVSDESGVDELYVIPFPGRGEKRQLSTRGAAHYYWTRNGKEVLYRAPDGMIMSISVENSNFSDPKPLFKLPATIESMDTVDGQRFLAVVAPKRESAITLVTNWTRMLDGK
jgi:Tol biopolymer transport system component